MFGSIYASIVKIGDSHLNKNKEMPLKKSIDSSDKWSYIFIYLRVKFDIDYFDRNESLMPSIYYISGHTYLFIYLRVKCNIDNFDRNEAIILSID